MERKYIIKQIREIVVSVVKHDRFEMRLDLTAADVDGWDSLSHMSIISEIETEFGVKFKLKELNKLQNMGSLVELVESKLANP